MNTKEEGYLYAFSCPWHGREIEVFCFRAPAKENRHLWHKYKRTLTEIEFEADELERLLRSALKG